MSGWSRGFCTSSRHGGETSDRHLYLPPARVGGPYDGSAWGVLSSSARPQTLAVKRSWAAGSSMHQCPRRHQTAPTARARGRCAPVVSNSRPNPTTPCGIRDSKWLRPLAGGHRRTCPWYPRRSASAFHGHRRGETPDSPWCAQIPCLRRARSGQRSGHSNGKLASGGARAGATTGASAGSPR